MGTGSPGAMATVFQRHRGLSFRKRNARSAMGSLEDECTLLLGPKHRIFEPAAGRASYAPGTCLFSERDREIVETPAESRCSALKRWASIAGPGLVVMLADTDCGSIVTAAQSGAQWGYSLLLLQLLLIPILFITQSLTVRLGVLTGKGHGELISEHFGAGWGWLSVLTLVVACAGAIVCQMSGIVAVGKLAGIAPWCSVVGTCGFLIAVVFSGSYRSVERFALALGLFELVFFVTMVASPVDFGTNGSELVNLPSKSSCYHSQSDCITEYLEIWTANIGAVIMPWMIFYQQSAVIDKGLTVDELRASSLDTLVGSIITQLIMAAVLITAAANLWSGQLGDDSSSLDSVSELIRSLGHSEVSTKLGSSSLTVLLALGLLGASLVASIVVSLTAAWGLGEVTGYARNLSTSPQEAPWFYVTYVGLLAVGAAVSLAPLPTVSLNVAIQIMNAALLPVVLGFLFVLARVALPKSQQLDGWYMVLVAVLFCVCSLFGILGAVVGVSSLIS